MKQVRDPEATKKEMKEAIQNTTRQNKFRHERKRKLESIDETTRRKLMGKVMSTRKK